MGTAERGSKWQEWKTKRHMENEGRRIDYIRGVCMKCVMCSVERGGGIKDPRDCCACSVERLEGSEIRFGSKDFM